ncbi:hypothetical protein [Streptomyces sp. NPDC047141]|uniref:hypothetical protein n=1 Tax=Streptomyces sp. NPDC047141 TaxID=3155738 RepID=UPI0033FD6125
MGLTVPDAPGLGVALDRGARESLHRRRTEDDGTHRDRDATAATRAVHPGRTPSRW